MDREAMQRVIALIEEAMGLEDDSKAKVKLRDAQHVLNRLVGGRTFLRTDDT